MGDTAPRPHILVIDETPGITDMMREVLQEGGYRVSVSPTPLEPARLVVLAPDVIVQELVFAGQLKTGWASLARMQRAPEAARIPVIVCTTADERVSEPAMAANLNKLGIRVVLKPFLLEDLLIAVSDALTARRLLGQMWRRQEVSGAVGSSREGAGVSADLRLLPDFTFDGPHCGSAAP